MNKLNRCISALIACCLFGHTSTAQNVVTDWAGIVQPAINSVSAPRPPGSSEVLHATIQLAIYNATIAIKGGYQFYGPPTSAPRGADVRAAVATAAYRTARARVNPSQTAYLDSQYQIYLENIAAGQPKNDGIRVGADAAKAILDLRANDGFNNVVDYECSSNPPPPGEFEPSGGCGTQPVDANVGQITPFALVDPSCFRPGGPNPLTSQGYTKDFIETRDNGRADSTVRTLEQTDIAYFWSEHAYVHWNRNLISLAVSSGLNVRETARFFALVHISAADAFIVGFNAKYFFRSWRPRTAIPRADIDGNSDTDPDPSWTPLLTVNHPEYPSAHGFFSSAILEGVAKYFHTRRLTWTLKTSKDAVPQLIQTERTFHDLQDIARQIDDARVWAGLHWRHSMHDGDQIGREVAKRVFVNYFRPIQKNN